MVDVPDEQLGQLVQLAQFGQQAYAANAQQLQAAQAANEQANAAVMQRVREIGDDGKQRYGEANWKNLVKTATDGADQNGVAGFHTLLASNPKYAPEFVHKLGSDKEFRERFKGATDVEMQRGMMANFARQIAPMGYVDDGGPRTRTAQDFTKTGGADIADDKEWARLYEASRPLRAAKRYNRGY